MEKGLFCRGIIVWKMRELRGLRVGMRGRGNKMGCSEAFGGGKRDRCGYFWRWRCRWL